MRVGERMIEEGNGVDGKRVKERLGDMAIS